MFDLIKRFIKGEREFAVFVYWGPDAFLEFWTYKVEILTRKELYYGAIPYASYSQMTNWISFEEAAEVAKKYRENDRKIRHAVQKLRDQSGSRDVSWEKVFEIAGPLYSRKPVRDWHQDIKSWRRRFLFV